MTDDAIAGQIGIFVKDVRITKQKTQDQLAEESGLSRYTISKIENGGSVTLQVLIQVLRALDSLYVLNNFKIAEIMSPLEAVKLKAKKKKRVRPTEKPNKTSSKKSNW